MIRVYVDTCTYVITLSTWIRDWSRFEGPGVTDSALDDSALALTPHGDHRAVPGLNLCLESACPMALPVDLVSGSLVMIVARLVAIA